MIILANAEYRRNSFYITLGCKLISTTVLVVLLAATVFFTVFLTLFIVKAKPSHSGLPSNRESEHIYAVNEMVKNFPDVILVVDIDGKVISFSSSASDFFGYTSTELNKINVERLMPMEFKAIHEKKRMSFMKGEPGKAMDNEVTCLSKTGEVIPVTTRVRTFQLDTHMYGLVSIQDLRKFKVREAALRSLSEHDPLTGLANRRLLDHDFQREWNRAIRNKSLIVALMIDVDFFKKYNDYYGHIEGDKCLKLIAKILQLSLQRKTDIVARFGGEEFMCLLFETTIIEAESVAGKIRVAIESENIPHATSTVSPWVTVSIGVAGVKPSEGVDEQNLIKFADSALYEAKSAGRNRIAVYKSESSTT